MYKQLFIIVIGLLSFSTLWADISATVDNKTAQQTVKNTPQAKDSQLNKLAENLIELRNEVEALNTELEEGKLDFKNKLNNISVRASELETNIQESEIKQKEYEKEVANIRSQLQNAQVDKETLKPAVLQAIEETKEEIKKDLPFKVKSRLAHLSKLENSLSTGEKSSATTLNQLWSFYEDEIRLANSNGLYRDTIILDGSEQLAEIAKIGMVFLFFKTIDDARVGYAKNVNGTWTYIATSDSKEKKDIVLLFDSFKKQVRTGYFNLPSHLVHIARAK